MTTNSLVHRAALACLATFGMVIVACTSDTTSAEAIGDPVATETADTTSWLISQTADSGRIEFTDGNATKVVLVDVDAHSILFSDRPERLANVVDTAELLERWDDMFADSAPNAVLVEHRPDGDTDSLVVVLSNPVLDPAADTLSYDIEVLADEGRPDSLRGLTGDVHDQAPAEFEAASLFIDNYCFGCPFSPG